ncbi:MAG: V-type ATPase 116kDa subunit family protein [Prolixibacteraceae bacterium]
MIIPMYKYGFLVFHQEYDDFLNDIQQLGVLHIIEREHPTGKGLTKKNALLVQISRAIQFLEKRNAPANQEQPVQDANGIIALLEQKEETLESLYQELETAKKELHKLEPWGDFSPEMLEKLKTNDIHLKFYSLSKKKFTLQFQEKFAPFLIHEDQHSAYFIVIQHANSLLPADTEELVLPEQSLSELEEQISSIRNKIENINREFDLLAGSSTSILRTEKDRIRSSLEFDRVILNTQCECDDRLMILEGWVPQTKKDEIDAYLTKNKVIFTSERATPKDQAPVLLKNGKFSRLFEPIGKIFSLPAYFELDLTVFFAPFFMLFFGFCLGDAGYGFLFILGAGIYKLKASPAIKPYLTLIQFLGLATVLFGFISGTLFGINLIETDLKITESIRKFFLDPAGMFNLAILLGAVQIIFGLGIKAANQIKQYGFTYGLGTFGWLFIILGSIVYLILTSRKIIEPNRIFLYLILGAGAFLILFFSDPKAGIFSRIGKGVWDIYSTVTGIFGDLLSYIRLFAIGLSSSILGYVVNDIGLTILHASPLIGPVLFALFLILGHTLNILISTLGSFVHPMRLTFVEFYKNAGFTGGGKEYKPFLK